MLTDEKALARSKIGMQGFNYIVELVYSMDSEVKDGDRDGTILIQLACGILAQTLGVGLNDDLTKEELEETVNCFLDEIKSAVLEGRGEEM